MNLTVDELENGIKKINLKGRLDIEGVEEIGLKITAETAIEKALVVIDLTQVDFLASVGIGLLLRSVKGLRHRGGEAVLLTTVPVVTLALETTHINEVVGMFGDLGPACQKLLETSMI